MQFNTVVKLGSLAFGVAQDQKVQELFTMLHHGAKRRGMLGYAPQPQSTSGPSNATSTSSESAGHPIPFSPAPVQGPPPATKHSGFAPPVPQAGLPGSFQKYATKDNAKKVLGWAGEIAQFLMK